jgi:hypothetical protein
MLVVKTLATNTSPIPSSVRTTLRSAFRSVFRLGADEGEGILPGVSLFDKVVQLQNNKAYPALFLYQVEAFLKEKKFLLLYGNAVNPFN